MKKSLLLSVAVFCGIVAFGQQEFQPSQYLQNIYILNPAAAGLRDYTDVNLGFRQQWAGFNGAPQTYYITANSMLGKGSMGANKIFALRVSDPYISLDNKEMDVDSKGTAVNRRVRHAVGGSFMVDKYGAFRQTVGALTYTVHVPLNQKLNLSAGVKGSINNFLLDQSLIQTFSDNDKLVTSIANSGNNSSTRFDANFGLMLYSDKFYAGYSTGNLLQKSIEFGNVTLNSKFVLHQYLTAAYRFELSDNVGLTPSVLMKFADNAPMATDLTAKVDYQRRMWLGFSLRPKDAFVTFVGFRMLDFMSLGYSYDATLSNIRSVSGGSHEIVLNFMLGK